MTQSIDERIVEMRFDNRQFENGVSETMNSVDKLKKGLKFDDATRSLSGLEKAGRSFSLGNIGESIGAISDRFSNLGIVGITVLQNLTNSALNAGKRMISALTLDPVKMGFDEYETKMNAIQTIMTNTASKGTTMDDVTKALNELNTYADQTIYDFAEMTRNIGTFTAAGIDLKTSTESIKGIANLAAGSGSTAQQASTAMYQLSQAMAAGTVKLQDWNSVVNAGMGGELFQKALEKTAAEMGKGRDMSVSFRESLQKGWITTEVLTKTLQKFAKDPSLLKAATQVKTFTQLFDTMKESVQSGWAQTWEAIIGNKDEAAGVLTEINNIFGNIVGASAKARNAMLEFWKANGGRYAMIEALFNAFKGLQEILEPIGKAFRSIFPPMTGKLLVEITKNIRDLTKSFIVSEETSNLLYRTFRGLFAILDIGKTAFMAIAKGVGEVVKYIFPASKGFLQISANIGDFLVKFDHSIQRIGVFTAIVKTIVTVIKKVADGVKMASTTISNAVKSFGKFDTSGIDAFSEHVTKSFSPFTKLGNLVRASFTKVGDVLKTISPVFYKLASIIGGAFDGIMTSITKSLDNQDGTSLINGAFFGMLLLGLKKFIKSLNDVAEVGGGLVANIKGILDGVRGSLESYQQSLKASILLKIAVSIGILALSLMTLAKIDPDKLAVAMGAMTAMFVELFGSMVIFQRMMGSTGFIAMGKITLSMIGLSVAVLILSNAVSKLAKLDWQGVAKGLAGIAGMCLILTRSSTAIGASSKGLIKASVGFIVFGTAINILVTAVERFGKMDTDKLMTGLIGVGALCAELVLFMKAADFSKMSAVKSVGFIALAVAIDILALSVKRFSQLDTTALIKGLAGVGVVLTEIALFVKVTGDSKKVASTAFGLILLGGAMMIFASAIEKMGKLSLEQIGKGLLAMGGGLAIIATALTYMPKNIIVQAGSLVILSGALIILATALTQMGGMTWEQIAKGLVTLAGSLTIIAVAMNFMQTALPGAAALLVIIAALRVLTPCLTALGNMSLAEIGKGLLALAGAFAVIGVAGVLLAPLTPIILGLSAAIALLGVGCLAVGGGLLAFATGMTALAAAGTAGAVALVAVITGIVSLIPYALKTLAKGLVDFARIIGEGAPVIFKAFKEIFIGLLDTITEVAPKIMTTVVTLLSSILDALVKAVPKLVDSGMKLIAGFLKGISTNIKDVISIAVDVVLNFVKGIISKIPYIVDAALKMIIAFINGLAEAIRKNHKQLFDAVANLIKSIVEAVVDLMPTIIKIGADIIGGIVKGIGSAVGQFVDSGKNLVIGLVNGVKDKLGLASDAGKDIGKEVSGATQKELGIHSPSKVYQDYGSNIVAGLIKGMKQDTPKAVTESKTMAKKVVKASGESFDEAVKHINEQKKLGKLSLSQELDEWEKLQTRYKKGSKERTKVDQEVYRVKQSLLKDEDKKDKEAYDKAIERIDDKKYYNQLSLAQELKAYQTLATKYKKDSEERKKIDKEIYRIKKEQTEAIAQKQKDVYDKETNAIENMKFYGTITDTQELARLQNDLKKFKLTAEEREEIQKKIFTLKKQITQDQDDLEVKVYDNEIKRIENLEYYNNLSLGQKLEALENVQKTYILNDEEQESLEKQIYDVKKEMTDKKKELDDDYYANTKEINDKMSADIKTLNDEYDNAVKSRSDALYATHSLFDKVDEQDSVNGSDLIQNLRDQVKEFELWQANITTLSHKGIDDGLLDELRNMGPKALAQIQALNDLSKKDLDQYVNLWKVKSAEATAQAINELEPMKKATEGKIFEITKQTESDLDTLKTTWIGKIQEITSGTNIEIDKLSTSIPSAAEKLKENLTVAFNALVTSVKPIMGKDAKWPEVGTNIILGMVSGLKGSTSLLVTAATSVAKSALDAAKKTLGIHSPSTEFAKVGMYAVKGLVAGLSEYSGTVEEAGANTGNVAINSLRNAMKNVSDVVSSDLDMIPTIRPVVDMTDVQNGIDSTFNKYQGLNVSTAINKVGTISRTGSTVSAGSTLNQNDNSITTPIQITQYNTVRNDQDINKINQGLKNIVDRYSYAKGVLVP